jgi:hypothetical protein
LYVVLTGRRSALLAGDYTLHQAMTGREIATLLADGKIDTNEVSVKILEGWTAEQIAAELERLICLHHGNPAERHFFWGIDKEGRAIAEILQRESVDRRNGSSPSSLVLCAGSVGSKEEFLTEVEKLRSSGHMIRGYALAVVSRFPSSTISVDTGRGNKIEIISLLHIA